MGREKGEEKRAFPAERSVGKKRKKAEFSGRPEQEKGSIRREKKGPKLAFQKRRKGRKKGERKREGKGLLDYRKKGW